MTDLVRVRIGNEEKSLGRAYALAHNLTVLDEPAIDSTGRVRRATRVGGRPKKPRKSVDQVVAERRDTNTPSASKAEEKAAAKTVEPADSTTNRLPEENAS